jgi:hypothetical protein
MKTLTYSSTWWPSQLHRVAMMGDRIVSENKLAMLERDGDFFVMVGPTGRHSLSITATDAYRLQAHWKGFMERAAAVRS